MALRLRLAGRPHAVVDGDETAGSLPPKAWALLAVLVIADRPVSRRRLAGLLFTDAADPLAALRWTLSRLRRELGEHLSFEGDPVRLTRACDYELDLAGEPLLDGFDDRFGPAFDDWLLAERARLEPAAETRLAELGLPAIDVRTHIEAGRGAIAAGAVRAGVGQLRDAVRLSGDDEALRAIAAAALGGNLVHAVGASVAEGRRALRDAAYLAQRVGDRATATAAFSDLAYVENAAGRVRTAERLLASASAAAGDDPDGRSTALAIRGMFLADRGHHDRALLALGESAGLAEATGRFRQAAWSLSIGSRSLLQLGRRDEARERAERSLTLATGQRWTAMLPWMGSILADLDLADRRPGDARRRLNHAWSAALLLEDACWQAMSARGLGLVELADGNLPEALRWLAEARRCAGMSHDRYAWIDAWVQQATHRTAVAARLPSASTEAERLATIVSRSALAGFA